MRLSSLTDGLARRVPIAEARATWAQVRTDAGFRPTTPPILTRPAWNHKLAKGQQFGLSLLPARLAGVGNVCPYSTRACRSSCLNTAGRGTARFVQESRLARTVLLVEHPAAFATLVEAEIMRLPEGAAVRLNVFSDLPWEQIWPEVFTVRSDLQFYDYTKWPVGARVTPANYHLTYSASELWTDEQIADAVQGGTNVTVVLDVKPTARIPATWNGLPVIDGDRNDARYMDPDGVVVGLRAKGRARRDKTTFVRKQHEQLLLLPA